RCFHRAERRPASHHLLGRSDPETPAADVTVAERRVRRTLERLGTDTPYFCSHALQIVTRGGERSPLKLRPGQLKIEAAMREQEEDSKPIRIVILKARQTGASTYVQAKVLQRLVHRQNRRARVVAHDDETAQSPFEIGQTMYAYLPAEIKPPLQSGQRGRFLLFG